MGDNGKSRFGWKEIVKRKGDESSHLPERQSGLIAGLPIFLEVHGPRILVFASFLDLGYLAFINKSWGLDTKPRNLNFKFLQVSYLLLGFVLFNCDIHDSIFVFIRAGPAFWWAILHSHSWRFRPEISCQVVLILMVLISEACFLVEAQWTAAGLLLADVPRAVVRLAWFDKKKKKVLKCLALQREGMEDLWATWAKASLSS